MLPCLDHLEPPFTGQAGNSSPSMPQPRRDLLGQHLDRAGYYCELKGNTLVIKPHPGTKPISGGSGSGEKL